ncbi:hypothetical protein [Thalassospira sp.]
MNAVLIKVIHHRRRYKSNIANFILILCIFFKFDRITKARG